MDLSDHRERFVKSFREPGVSKTVVFIDLKEFTAYKQNHGLDWLMTLGTAFDVFEPRLLAHGGEIVKYLGDGVLVVFEAEHAAEAINCAIEIQEAMSEINRPQGSGQVNMSACGCSIGIATGIVHQYQTAQDTADYVGSTVDLAQRLCQAANEQAIWLDSATIEEARIGQVQCKLGEAQSPRRRGGNLLGPEETIRLRGFTNPVPYKEVVWSSQKFGVASKAVTEATDRPANAIGQKPPAAAVPQPASRTPMSGKLSWREEKKYGFIRTDDNQTFYTDCRYIVKASGVIDGASAHFMPMPPKQDGKSPVAAATVFEGQEVSGWVVRPNSEKPFCFIATFDRDDNKIEFFHYLGDNPLALKEDEEVRFVVTTSPKGLRATRVTRTQSDDQAA
jgi:class 3 adenylate cyclase/cold shock CspA family protein